MDANLQLAESRKYDSSLVWHFAEIKPGLFALYGYDRSGEIYLTHHWDKVLAHYRARPVYVPKPKLVLERIDLSKLEITI